MHRPDPSMYGIHCTLLSDCFGHFKDDFNGGAELTRVDFFTAQKMCVAMTGFLSHPDRQKSMNDILSRYLNIAVTIMPVSSSGIIADGGFATQCGMSAADRMIPVILESGHLL